MLVNKFKWSAEEFYGLYIKCRDVVVSQLKQKCYLRKYRACMMNYSNTKTVR